MVIRSLRTESGTVPLGIVWYGKYKKYKYEDDEPVQ
jgi:hypothetical protein